MATEHYCIKKRKYATIVVIQYTPSANFFYIMRISETTIADIKAHLRIEEVLGDFITLKKGGGQNLWARCPFPGHQERTPSFSVHPDKGFYKCFGCGESGDTIDFLEKIQGMTYPESLEYLAKKYHITFVTTTQDSALDAQQRYHEGLYLLMDIACTYYEKLLATSPTSQKYLLERGITNALIQRFRLGYSPDAWRDLYQHTLEKGYEKERLLDTGLVIEKETSIYDRFRNRITFPIMDTLGHIVGFGARTITDEKAKYINSPETPIYHKGHHLYGLYQAKEAIRKHDACYIVEGYTDVIAMHHAGLENTVASSGTAMTPQQIMLLKRYTKNIILLFDADEAGIKATIRGVDLLLAQGMNIKVAMLPKGEDPASYLQILGIGDFSNYLASHQEDFVTFHVQYLLKQSNDPANKIKTVKNIVKSISVMPDSIQQSVYLELCSRLIDIKKEILEQELTSLQHATNTLKTTFPKQEKQKKQT